MNPWLWVQVALFAMKLLVEYGPKLIKIGVEIYEKVEEMAERGFSGVLTPEQKDKRIVFKRTNFDDLVGTKRVAWKEVKGMYPTVPEVEKFREDIWRKKNPGKRPRKLATEVA